MFPDPKTANHTEQKFVEGEEDWLLERGGTSYQWKIEDGDLANEEAWIRCAGDPGEPPERDQTVQNQEWHDVILSGATGQSYNNNWQRYAAGVWLILSDRAQRALIGYEAVSDRALTAQFHHRSHKLMIICVYIPQSMLIVEVWREA